MKTAAVSFGDCLCKILLRGAASLTAVLTVKCMHSPNSNSVFSAKHKEAQMYVKPTADTNILQKQCCITAYLMAADGPEITQHRRNTG